MATGAEIVDRMRQAASIETDTDLAGFLNVPAGTVSSWRRRNSVPIEHLAKAAGMFNVTLDWLITGNGEKSRPREKRLDLDLMAIAFELLDRALSRMFREVPQPRYLQFESHRQAKAFATMYDAVVELYEQLIRAGLGRHLALVTVRRYHKLSEQFEYIDHAKFMEENDPFYPRPEGILLPGENDPEEQTEEDDKPS